MNPGQPSTPAPPVWLITECSCGFGLELATQALARGHQVAVTARNVDQVRALAGHSRAIVLPLDVTDAAQVDAAVSATMTRFGTIDVLVKSRNIRATRMASASFRFFAPLGVASAGALAMQGDILIRNIEPAIGSQPR